MGSTIEWQWRAGEWPGDPALLEMAVLSHFHQYIENCIQDSLIIKKYSVIQSERDRANIVEITV